MTEKIVALEDLWGQRARDLEGRPESELSGLTLATALIAPPAPDLVRRAIEALVEAHGAIDPGLGSRAGRDEPAPVPPPMFEESGLAPKHLCRILRFRHACELAMSRGSGWAAIAADAGYFDQAHLIHDFHEFTGRAPVSVFSNTAAAGSIHNRA